MPEFLFRLNDVPDDEADDIRKILCDNNIEFYETSAGRWGISTAAIWLNNKEQMQQASVLIREYQQGRQIKIKMEYDQLLKEGKTETFLTRTWRHPVRFFLYLALVITILYISIKPFLFFGT